MPAKSCKIMGIFKRTYTAEEIHRQLDKCAQKYAKQCELPKSDPKLVEKNRRLRDLGFTSSTTFLGTQPTAKMQDREQCFKFFKDNFKGCIILRESDFFHLLQKYNLCSGRLNYYLGAVPDKNIDEICDAVNTLKKLGHRNCYSNKGAYILDRVTVEEKRWRDNARADKEELLKILSNTVNRFPFQDCVNWTGLSSMFTDCEISYNSFPASPLDLFIAGPIQEFKQLVEVEYVTARRAEDPFVFQRTPYGIVVFSKWGKEADDEIFE